MIVYTSCMAGGTRNESVYINREYFFFVRNKNHYMEVF